MRKLIFLLLGVFIVNVTTAQQDAQYSLNMFNNAIVNPGYSGTNGMICASSVNRIQWLGFGKENGAPVSLAFNINAPIEKISSGIGLNVVSDKLGFEKNTLINLNYSYIMKDIGVRGSQLGLGLGLGLFNKAIDGDWITPDGLQGTGLAQNPHNDLAVPNTAGEMIFDANFGAWYRTNDLYFGVSTTHLLGSKFKKFNSEEIKTKRHYYITAGYFMTLPDPKFELKPSIYIKTEFTTAVVDFSARLIYKKQFWGGLSYRLNSADAAIVMIGATLPNRIGFGIAYDVSMKTKKNPIGGYNNGTVELMLKYCFGIKGGGGKSKYGSVRFL